MSTEFLLRETLLSAQLRADTKLYKHSGSYHTPLIKQTAEAANCLGLDLHFLLERPTAKALARILQTLHHKVL